MCLCNVTSMHMPYITVTFGLRGWFAVLMTWNEEDQCYEPYESSPFAFASKEGAFMNARYWAQCEQLAVEY